MSSLGEVQNWTPYRQGNERLKREADHSMFVPGSVNKLENLHSPWKTSTSVYPPTRVLKDYIEVFMGFTHVYSAAKSLQSCLTLCDPIDISPPGSPSLGFSRQEHWSGLPFHSSMCESEVVQLCLTLSDPMDHSLPGWSIHGIFQARVLEWGAIAFSSIQCRWPQYSTLWRLCPWSNS